MFSHPFYRSLFQKEIRKLCYPTSEMRPFLDHYARVNSKYGLFLYCTPKVVYSRIPLNGTNSDISTLEERLKVLPSQTSSALIDSLTLYCVIWIVLSPLSCYNGFRRLKKMSKQSTAGKSKHNKLLFRNLK